MFLAVHRHGSFGRAATELLVTQPAVSERVRHLEGVLGRTVFERTTRGVVLTPTGEVLVPYAQRCVALTDETIEATRQVDGVPRLVVAVHSAFAQRLVPFVLGTLGGVPRRIVVRDAHSDEVPLLVLDGAADIGFALGSSARRGLARVSLPPDHVICVSTRDHAIARKRRPSPASLRDTLIAINAWGDGADAFLERLERLGVADWRVRRCGDAATALRLARHHNHVAFVARTAIDTTDRDLQQVPMPGTSTWTIRLDLLHRVADRNDRAIQTLLHAINTA